MACGLPHGVLDVMEPEKFHRKLRLQVIIKNRRMRGPDGVEVEATSGPRYGSKPQFGQDKVTFPRPDAVVFTPSPGLHAQLCCVA